MRERLSEVLAPVGMPDKERVQADSHDSPGLGAVFVQNVELIADHAPEGLGSTGNPEFNVPASLLGVPAVSLPLFELNGMPLGLQVVGYHDRDADLFAAAAWLMSSLTQPR